MSPERLRKAVRLVVAKKPNGSYQVAGDTNTYDVFWTDSPTLHVLSCTCPVGSSFKLPLCSHRIAVQHFIDNSQDDIPVNTRKAVQEHCIE